MDISRLLFVTRAPPPLFSIIVHCHEIFADMSHFGVHVSRTPHRPALPRDDKHRTSARPSSARVRCASRSRQNPAAMSIPRSPRPCPTFLCSDFRGKRTTAIPITTTTSSPYCVVCCRDTRCAIARTPSNSGSMRAFRSVDAQQEHDRAACDAAVSSSEPHSPKSSDGPLPAKDYALFYVPQCEGGILREAVSK